MADMHDFTPATRRMAELVAGVPEDSLGAPTPCSDYTVGDLLDHIGSLTVAFASIAAKSVGNGASPPLGNASNLAPDWRTRIPADLERLAEAWREPDAWSGMTKAGGFEMPAEMAAAVATEELVVHGWDLARATDQPFESDPASLDVAIGFLEQFSTPETAASRGDAYAPVVGVAGDAPTLDRVVGFSGRDPNWTPA